MPPPKQDTGKVKPPLKQHTAKVVKPRPKCKLTEKEQLERNLWDYEVATKNQPKHPENLSVCTRARLHNISVEEFVKRRHELAASMEKIKPGRVSNTHLLIKVPRVPNIQAWGMARIYSQMVAMDPPADDEGESDT